MPKEADTLNAVTLALTLTVAAMADQVEPELLVRSLVERRRSLDPEDAAQRAARSMIDVAAAYLVREATRATLQ